MISFGSRDEVVFILHVKRRDRGLTLSSFWVDTDRNPSFRDPLVEEESPPVWSLLLLLSLSESGNATTLLLNFEDNLLKNDGLVCDTDEVSCVWRGAPPGPLNNCLLSLVCPEWKVDRLADPRGKALLLTVAADKGDNPPPAPGLIRLEGNSGMTLDVSLSTPDLDGVDPPEVFASVPTIEL